MAASPRLVACLRHLPLRLRYAGFIGLVALYTLAIFLVVHHAHSTADRQDPAESATDQMDRERTRLWTAATLVGRRLLSELDTRPDHLAVPSAINIVDQVEFGTRFGNHAKLAVIGIELCLLAMVGSAIVATLSALKPYWEPKRPKELDPENPQPPIEKIRDRYGGSDLAGPSVPEPEDIEQGGESTPLVPPATGSTV